MAMPMPAPMGTQLATELLAGWARVHGERWRVASATPAAAGERVRVTARHGLTLTVVPIAPLSAAVGAPGTSQGERS